MSEPITQFQGTYRWLSNFWLVPVMLDGDLYPSVEHAYQAAKTLDMDARQRFQDIMLKPGQAKQLGKRVALRTDWTDARVPVMLELLRQKFTDAKLRAQLLATDKAELVEGNDWNDTYWGVCRGKGQNQLGKLLMQVRGELRG